jgi:hypothetical protein
MFNEKHIWIDKAYVAYSPPVVEGLTLAGGKFGMPLETADILWDGDVNPEGLYQKMVIKAGPVHPFFTLGQFFLEEEHSEHNGVDYHDAGILAGQLGIKVAMDTVYFLIAGSYYDYDEYEDVYASASGNPVMEGCLAAGDFNIFDLIGEFGMKFGKIPFKVKLVWLVNTAEDAEGEAYWEGKDTAWGAYVNLGKCKKNTIGRSPTSTQSLRRMRLLVVSATPTSAAPTGKATRSALGSSLGRRLPSISLRCSPRMQTRTSITATARSRRCRLISKLSCSD